MPIERSAHRHISIEYHMRHILPTTIRTHKVQPSTHTTTPMKSIMKSIEWATNEFVSTVIISNHPVGMSMVAPATPGRQPQDLGLTHREYRPFSEGLHNVGGYNNPTKAANVVQCQTHLETPDARMSRCNAGHASELATTSTIVICLPWP